MDWLTGCGTRSSPNMAQIVVGEQSMKLTEEQSK
jgi:hypothetical protein